MYRVIAKCVLLAGAVASTASCKGKDRPTAGEVPAAPAALAEPAEEVMEGDERELAPRGDGPAILPRAGELALVSGSGQLFAAPRPDALSFGRGRFTLAHAFPARVVVADKTWTQLELLGADPTNDACHQMPDGLTGLQLRVFARTDSLLYTAARRIETSFADQTFVGLQPGVPLYPVRGKPAVYLAGDGIALITAKLGDADVRRSFVAPAEYGVWEAFPAAPGTEKVPGSHVPHDTTGVTDGTQPVVLARDPRDDVAGEVTAAWKHGDGLLVDVVGPCVAVRSLIGGVDLGPRAVPGEGAMGPDRGPAIGAGTELFWSDGSPAGRASAEAHLGPLQPDSQGRLCASTYFDSGARPGSVHPLQPGTPMPLCLAAP